MCVCSSECVCEGRCEIAKKALTSSFITLVCFYRLFTCFHFLKKLRRDYIAFVYSTYAFDDFLFSIDRVYYVCFKRKENTAFCFFLVLSSCEILLFLSNSQGCVKLHHTYTYVIAVILSPSHAR